MILKIFENSPFQPFRPVFTSSISISIMQVTYLVLPNQSFHLYRTLDLASLSIFSPALSHSQLSFYILRPLYKPFQSSALLPPQEHSSHAHTFTKVSMTEHPEISVSQISLYGGSSVRHRKEWGKERRSRESGRIWEIGKEVKI